jgi:UDP-4-amino-4,6-dideoxy-N-acetyl-beta-L-altrosamine N-acetyltransferase
MANSFKPNTLRILTQEDLSLVRAWRNHPSISHFMLTQHDISETEHLNWFNKSVANPNRRLYIFQRGSLPSGFVCFDRNPSNHLQAEWGFYGAPASAPGNGKSLGITALNYAFSELHFSEIIGKVLPLNLKSIRFHERLGFQLETGHSIQSSISNAGREQIVFKLGVSDWKFQMVGK